MQRLQKLLGGQIRFLKKLNTAQKRVGILLSTFSVYALVLGIIRVLSKPDIYNGVLDIGILALFTISVVLICTIFKENNISKILQLFVIFFSSMFSSISNYANQWSILMIIMGIFLMIAYGWYNKYIFIKSSISLSLIYLIFALVSVPEGKNGWLISASLIGFIIVFILFMWIIFKNILEVYEKHLHEDETKEYELELSKRDNLIIEYVTVSHKLTEYIDKNMGGIHGQQSDRKVN